MWQAIENAVGLVNPNGLFVIAIYNRVWTSGFRLKFKQQYNRSGKLGKQLLVWYLYAPCVKGKSPFKVTAACRSTTTRSIPVVVLLNMPRLTRFVFLRGTWFCLEELNSDEFDWV